MNMENKKEKKLPIVVLISGNGSNLQAIINAISDGRCEAEIKAVISNKKDAYGLIRAKEQHIPTECLPHQDYPNREAYDEALIQCIDKYQPQLIVLAGFMRILSPHFIQHYPNQIINIHPALLPKYQGLNTHRRVLEAKELEHGVTIHVVTEDLDAGPILAQQSIPVLSEDTIETLEARIHKLEHQLYPKVIHEIARGKILC
jgi:phosphoribosylglycinamide formyltransferase-1